MLVDKKVNIRLSSSNTKHFRELGYDIPTKQSSWNKKIVVPIDAVIEVNTVDLQKHSNVRIKYKCEECGKIVDYISKICTEIIK